MDVTSVQYIFDVVSRKLPEAGVEFLMIGGHAVNYYGYSRATIDVDFMIASSDVQEVREVMKAAGFTNVSESDNVIFFNHPENPHRVDYLKVDSGSMTQLLQNAEHISYANVEVSAPRLKDLIAMKLFALANGAKQREEKDLPDIVHLSMEHGLSAEGDLKPLCERFANNEVYEAVRRRISEEGGV